MVNAIASFSEASYIVWVDGGVYYAKNGHTGAVTSNADAATLIQAVFTALPSGGQVDFKEGTFSIPTALIPEDKTYIKGVKDKTIFTASGGVNSFFNLNYRSYITIDGIDFTDNTGGAFCIDQYAGDYITIKNCIFHTVERAIRIVDVDGIIITKNRFTDINNDRAIIIYGGRNHNVTDNLFYDSPATGSEVPMGIVASDSDTMNLNNLIISGNCFSSWGGDPIVLAGDLFPAHNIQGATITGNTFDGCFSGIYLHGAAWNNANVLYVTVNANSMRYIDYCGIYVTFTYYPIISNNVIHDVGLTGTPGTSQTLGIILSDSYYANVIGNTVDDSQGVPTMEYGIGEWGTHVDNNVISNNIIQGATLSNIHLLGANTKIKGNIGYITENSGTATITAAATSVVVTHLCSYTPSALDVSVVPTGSIGTGLSWYVDTFTPTEFTLHLMAVPGLSANFAWAVHRTP
jgi:hypothetical protein